MDGEIEANPETLLQLAIHAYKTQRFALAARFFDAALELSPELMNDRKQQQAYNAACEAALASCGWGMDDPKPEVETRAKLRDQAHQWLESELAVWRSTLDPHKRCGGQLLRG